MFVNLLLESNKKQSYARNALYNDCERLDPGSSRNNFRSKCLVEWDSSENWSRAMREMPVLPIYEGTNGHKQLNLIGPVIDRTKVGWIFIGE